MADYRTWGDGLGDIREHVIGDIDLHSPPQEQFCTCTVCGTTVTVGDHLNLFDAWQAHRGREVHVTVHRLADMATDREVHQFLRKIEDTMATDDGDEYIDVAWKPWRDDE